ncbi:hypothetical protein IW261DRAFT_1036985 [Armillaria novae-zelandiae]|uniref:Uncharacterized protein n=1 Tax=Armillaria novae-zelandiae TaxID=153914 RepID=A0AA39UHA2_9AGAR|nr:hypothetical protein IW261DRAFT_1036985 [Armillaria novae-zelandiae]
MLVPTIIKGMSRGGASALKRTRQIASHMMSTTAEDTVKFESLSELRAYTLNRPEKLNALDEQMLGLLRPKIEVDTLLFYPKIPLTIISQVLEEV